METIPGKALRVYILWTPFMQWDNRSAAERASSYVPDERAVHYWDLWKYGNRTFAAKLKIPEREAWDLFVFYQPHQNWQEPAPEATFWMQARGLPQGEAYTKEALTARLQTWLP